jgi:hypothetical protein
MIMHRVNWAAATIKRAPVVVFGMRMVALSPAWEDKTFRLLRAIFGCCKLR